MSDEILESTVGSGDPPEIPEEETLEEKPEVPAEEPQEPPKERTVPLSALKEARAELKTMREELKELRVAKPEPVAEDEATRQAEAWFQRNYEKVRTQEEARKEEEEAKALSEFDEEAESLKEIYDDFDTDKVVEFANQYKLDDLESAYKLWKVAGSPKGTPAPKPKLPSGAKTSDALQGGEKKADVAGKSLWQIVQEAKKDFSLK